MASSPNYRLALADVVDGFRSVHIWPALGWQDVRQRYRRSLLGPLWLTISTGIMVAVMGPLYGRLFNQDINSYFASLAIGFVIWQLIAQVINESCTAFITAESYIKQVKLPLSVHVLRVLWKSIIVFMHNMLVVVAVLLYVRQEVDWSLLLFPVGLAVFAVNAYTFGMISAIVSTRFRDIPILMTNLVQITFFLTPVLWYPTMLGRHQWVANLNPFYHLLEIMRGPLVSSPFNVIAWGASIAMTIFGLILLVFVLARFRARVAYWV